MVSEPTLAVTQAGGSGARAYDARHVWTQRSGRMDLCQEGRSWSFASVWVYWSDEDVGLSPCDVTHECVHECGV